MNETCALRVGDMVEVCRIFMFEGTKWFPATIVAVHPDRIEVKFKAPLDGFEYEALSFHSRGRNWR
jgi:hypothetical protein